MSLYLVPRRATGLVPVAPVVTIAARFSPVPTSEVSKPEKPTEYL